MRPPTVQFCGRWAFQVRGQAIQFLLKKGYEWQDIGWSVFVGTVDEPDQVTY